MGHSLAEVLMEAAERENVRVQAIQGRLVARGPQEAGKLLTALIQHEAKVVALLEARGMDKSVEPAILILDAVGGVIRHANGAACNLLGWNMGELAGVDLADLINFREQSTFSFARARMASTGRFEHTRWRIISRNGLDADVEMWGRQLLDDMGQPVSYLFQLHAPRPQVLRDVLGSSLDQATA